MNLGYRCHFAKTCPLYKGEEKAKDMPLPLFRNVFCNRGMKGWKNCSRFNKLTEEENQNEK
ncbi:hypothetical protein SAMN05444285_12456 [Draconibacterium orientale]|jgi:hypothetical protein|uniref:Uncharacterized protein n=1 Tax=Draconibacterium orientale TaxID=1168034 RepID=X5DGF3_9BACT|nr:hypothetical protein FH5T_13970 [Draconibacterium orientale]SET81818.1 hypothetical protein SAMN05444285_12456 [Draconibacterium orientale]